MRSYKEKFMRLAIDLAAENIKNGGGPFGAVIVKDGDVVATGCTANSLNDLIPRVSDLWSQFINGSRDANLLLL